MAQKFIINDNEIILGDVEFHKELIVDQQKHKQTIGGGRWFWDEDGKIVYFYSSSTDFGQVTKEQFESAFANSILSPCWDECKIVFSQKEWFADAKKDYQTIKE